MKPLEYFLLQYLRHRPLFLSLIRAKEAALFQKYLPLKHPVLDVGCGDGFFAQTALSDMSHVTYRVSPINKPIIDVGLDVADSRVKEARKLHVYKKIIIYDGEKMPFDDNSFASVVSNCVLEHIPNLSFTLKEIQRVLKPGGLFLTTVMAAPWEDHLFGNVFGGWYKTWMRKKQVHHNLLTRGNWDHQFEKAGFEIIECGGYLSSSACSLIDVSHYLSLPSLVSYKLCGRWVLFPRIVQKITPAAWLARILSQPVSPELSGALFFALTAKPRHEMKKLQNSLRNAS